MFADIAKMAAKVVALVAGVAIIIIVLTSITVPHISFGTVASYLNLSYSIGCHYIGSTFPTIWTLGLAILGLDVAIIGARLALIAIRWVLKVNE